MRQQKKKSQPSETILIKENEIISDSKNKWVGQRNAGKLDLVLKLTMN